MRPFEVIAVTLAGHPDPAIAIAASRAGGIGVLDVEYTWDEKLVWGRLERLTRFVHQPFGIKVDGFGLHRLTQRSSAVPDRLQTLILACESPGEWVSDIRTLQQKGLRVLLESTSLHQARSAEEIGMDGVIAKGNEAGGHVSSETTFILVQRFMESLSIPVWAQGGIGPHTASACYVAGAQGVVLDSQLLLTRESPLSEALRSRVAVMDGSETTCLGSDIGLWFRVCTRLGTAAVRELEAAADALSRSGLPKEELAGAWRNAIAPLVVRQPQERSLFLLGQDVGLAASMAQRYVTVGGVVEAIQSALGTHCQAAARLRPLDEGSPLAASSGTRYPIFQGPMARISDVPDFALRVAKAGALPFMAVGWSSGRDLEELLEETERKFAEHPWGVGLLGFLPQDLYSEQIRIVEKHHPPFALIAGGRPNQAKALEQKGIPTFVHVPSPGLLKMFLESGIRRLIFEGREAGGHVGPRCSFVLWEQMIEALSRALPSHASSPSCQVIFAGGIHDALSASMVAVMAAPLADRGVELGVQMGSAYLFTEEAVSTGAILGDYQGEALRCTETQLLETGVGHTIQCMETPYARAFREEKRRLASQGKSGSEVQQALERMNTGRLRMAAKGLAKHPGYGVDLQSRGFVMLSEEQRNEQGLYMIGQLVAIRDRVVTLEQLHEEISKGSCERIEAIGTASEETRSQSKTEQPSDIAVIGIACILPKAPDLRTYWSNILNKVNAIIEVLEDRWDPGLYYDTDPKSRDRVYSKWGAFLEDVPFDPLKYGMPPNSLSSIEPLQLLTLEVAARALEDAGYANRPFPRDRTSVVFGISGSGELGQTYAFRSALPTFFGDASQQITEHFQGTLPEWTEDSFPGILMNVAAGRVANRFDLGGTNFTVDGACASSLAAVYVAVRELESHSSDMVIVGGADTMQNPFTYLCFAKTQALSSRGKCCPLDQSADGIVLGEGIGVVLLKRLADAERDGDRIYAVIKGVGAGSDGRDRSLTAPRVEGQIRTMERAYAKAGISPATLGLVEAHATGTEVGDQAELEALSRFLKKYEATPRSCAVGSVKSMIGHTKSTAGIASLIKMAMALYDKVLPPTLGVERPNRILLAEQSPLYANTEPRPWVCRSEEHPRRGGVSAFGFGGTNFHVVMEEYTQGFLTPSESFSRSSLPNRSSELFLWAGRTPQALLDATAPLAQAIGRGAKVSLEDLAFTVSHEYRKASSQQNGPLVRLAVVADSLEDLLRKLSRAREALSGSEPAVWDLRGVYFSESPLNGEGRLAFLFPGQGSQYPNMLADLAVAYPAVREVFERSDAILKDRLEKPLTTFVFPTPAFTREEELAHREGLAQAYITQPAIGTASLALFHLLTDLGLHPHMVAGHSYGEYVALCVAGAMSEEDLILLSEARGRLMAGNGESDSGTMAAVSAGVDQVSALVTEIEEVWISNLNAPEQTVISGTRQGMETALARFRSMGIQARPIPVACGFHSPLVSQACERLKEILQGMALQAPRCKVFSNVSAAPYPDEPEAIAQQLASHLRNRVDFIREIEAMVEQGARIFVEVGPGRVLTGLVDRILRDRPHLAVCSNQQGRSGLDQILHLVAQLAVHGIPLRVEKLYDGRPLRIVDVLDPAITSGHAHLPPTTWLVNGARARPLGDVLSKGPDRAIVPMQILLEAEKPAAGQASPKERPHAAGTPATWSGEESKRAKAGKPDANPGTVPVRASSRPADSAADALIQFQRLMDRFLVTQREVMLAYLRGKPESATVPVDLRPHAGREAAGSEDRQELAPQVSRDERPSLEETLREPSLPGPGAVSSGDAERAPEAVAGSFQGTECSGERLEALLLDIVSERTGYPRDMLGLDVDLEADLGIDSIKRIEILGTLIRQATPGRQEAIEREMDGVAGLKTLRGILQWFEERSSLPSDTSPTRTGPEPEPIAPSKPERAGRQEEISIPRFILSPVPRPMEITSSLPLPTGVTLMTDDEQGIAEELSAALRQKGLRVVRVRLHNRLEECRDGSYLAALDSPEGVCDLMDAVRRRQGPLSGLIHLLPLRQAPRLEQMELSRWRDRVRQDLKSLFYLIKDLEKDILQAARQGGGWVVGATGMGGDFACGPRASGEDFCPAQAGIPGLLKSLAIEWPGVRVKAVDLNLREPSADLANHLVQEFLTADRLVEVGYRGSERLSIEPVLSLVTTAAESRIRIDAGSVILVSGGARGITADVAIELARRYRPNLVLVGRSPMPAAEEPADTAGLNTSRELKSALIARMRGQGQTIRLPDVEAAHKRLLAEREMRANLLKMEREGSRVEYVQADVRDGDRFGQIIDETYRSHGRLDGVIHGAGIIEDKLIQEKTPASFDRVLDTKADSGFVLARKLRPDSLRFLVFFTSVAGRFGNKGQADYAAANEILNKLAVYLDRRWPGRVVAMNWGPWERTGMVTPEIHKQFTERGIQLIPRDIGPRRLCEELEYGKEGEAEVVIGGFDGWKSKEPVRPASTIQAFPMVGMGKWSVHKEEGSVELTRILDPRRDLFLRDHQIDGHPVLPAAFAIELMAEVAVQNWPDMEVASLTDIAVLRGIVLKNGPKTVRVETSPVSCWTPDSSGRDLRIRITDNTSRRRAYYEATVQLRKTLPPPPPYETVHSAAFRAFPTTVEDAYRRWLFHGPTLQCISCIEGFNEQEIVATVIPSVPERCIQDSPPGEWLIDPVVMDSGFQLAILWARVQHDFTPLPSRFPVYRRYAPLSGERIRCYLRTQADPGSLMMRTNLYFVAPDGRILGMFERAESTCSRALNARIGVPGA